MSENTHISPYAAAKLVNEALHQADAAAKPIPPQMMYNYTTARVRQGKAPFIPFDPEKGVELKGLQEWTKAYVAKRTATTKA